jgi:hypothetical protein
MLLRGHWFGAKLSTRKEKTSLWSRVLGKLIVAEPQNRVLCSQEPTTGPYSEPGESSPQLDIPLPDAHCHFAQVMSKVWNVRICSRPPGSYQATLSVQCALCGVSRRPLFFDRSKNLRTSVHAFVSSNNSRSARSIFMKFDTGELYEKFSSHFSRLSGRTAVTTTLHKAYMCLCSCLECKSAKYLSKRKLFQKRSCREKRRTLFICRTLLP